MKTYKALRFDLVLIGLFVALSWPLVSLAQDPRPNFIVILTDDQRMDALGANGNDYIMTPSLDKLAGQSLVFNQANVVFSLCSPSRAALLTGRYGSANGVLKLGSGLKENEKSLAQYLKDEGYNTGFAGKWHLSQTPHELGFDEAVYFEGNGAYYNREIFEANKVSRPAQHCDEYCVDWSIDYLENIVSQASPFFLLHCTQLPHMNGKLVWNAQLSTLLKYEDKKIPVPESRGEDLSNKPPYLKQVRNLTKAKDYGYPALDAIEKHIKQYYAVITEMDDALGRLIKKVEDLGLMNNTYIIFMSDNGWMLGEHGFTSKVLPYRPSTTIPFFIKGPGVTSFSREELVLNIDIAPTVLDLAGVEIPRDMHGESLKELLKPGNNDWRKEFVYEGLGGYGGADQNLTVFDGRYRYIQTFSDSSLSELVFEELYDNLLDPDEMINMVKGNDQKNRIEDFKKVIQNHKKEILKQ
ncbi:sulfatase-like hydrolase/transferase [Echinicola shivajiensis]|uniref:sulfatase-like hydrolase/transferase n=1 Tax=Echinicola shivajiensis TaxID=1035916 RepID=UPI001BFC685F|nr:sulfatase-like hydrolase/transferase [Echinicola shivajiensis]